MDKAENDITYTWSTQGKLKTHIKAYWILEAFEELGPSPIHNCF